MATIKYNLLMRSTIAAALFAIISVTLSAQDLTITETENHVKVTGTNLKMIPPKQFTKGENFYGFQQLNTHSTIVVFQVKNNFTKQTESFKAKHLTGFKVNNIRRFKINEDSAVHVSVIQEWEGDVFCKEILAIGNNSRTVVINAACIVEHKHMVQELRSALFSSFIDGGEIESAIGLVDFTLDCTNTDMELYKKATKGLAALVYSGSGIKGNPMLIATKSVTAINNVDHKTFVKESYKDLNLVHNETLVSFNEIVIAGLKGYESIITGEDKNGGKVTLYRVIVFTPNNYYYSFAGITRTDGKEENIERFKKLVKTFKQR